MGLGGTLDCFSDLLGSSHKYSNKKQMQTVELKVRMDCEGCELKVRNAFSSIKGVNTVLINMKQQKVTVTGYVDQKKVLKKAQATGKKTEIWPYVPYSEVNHPRPRGRRQRYGLMFPYSEVNHPYSVGAYDKKAPPGYVRKVEFAAVSTQESRQEDQITNMFGDENPNSCSIM